MEKRSEVVIYEAMGGRATLAVKLENDTVWLNLNQIAKLFKKDKSVVSRHIKNIYRTGELESKGTVAKNATVQIEGDREVIREIEFYNLDMIISVGYRVNSLVGTKFRIWATNVLKNHLVNGFSANPKRLIELEKQFEHQKETLERLRDLTNEFMIKTARRDVVNAVIDDVEKLKVNLIEINANITKLKKAKQCV